MLSVKMAFVNPSQKQSQKTKGGRAQAAFFQHPLDDNSYLFPHHIAAQNTLFFMSVLLARFLYQPHPSHEYTLLSL